MSVIVKGMEMPKSCWLCELSDIGMCELKGKRWDPDPGQPRRPDWCPLIPLPEKHGRLIDGDELADGCDDPHWCRWLSEIEDMPTIVDAEGDER